MNCNSHAHHNLYFKSKNLRIRSDAILWYTDYSSNNYVELLTTCWIIKVWVDAKDMEMLEEAFWIITQDTNEIQVWESKA